MKPFFTRYSAESRSVTSTGTKLIPIKRFALALLILIGLPSCGKMVLIEDEIFRYRRHTGSDSSVKAINGERFVDEKNFFTTMERDLKAIGWNRAARAAKLHSTSRLHAASLIPASIARGQNPWRLLRHLVS